MNYNYKDLGTVSELLEELMTLLDDSKPYMLSAKKRIVDSATIYDIVKELREKLPNELKLARALVKDSERIISEAQAEKEHIINKAKEHAEVLVSRDEIVKTAQEKAKAIMSEASRKASEKNRVTMEFIDGLMQESEEAITGSLNELKEARSALKNPRSAANLNTEE